MSRGAARSTLNGAEEAAQEALENGANALGGALAGFFRAAGERAGILFSPVTLLVGGLGSGVFAYDGRTRQPGRDAKRPRGFQPEDTIPEAARVAVPGSIFATAVACAFLPGTSFLSHARAGASAAKLAGARGRAELLEIVATKGATALAHSSVRKAFITQFGTIEEGLMTAGDLVAPGDLQVRAVEVAGGFQAPWAGGEMPRVAGDAHAIVVGDARGLFVALTLTELPEGASLEPFETTVPLTAAPVLRGSQRVSPGLPLSQGNDARVLGEARRVTGAFVRVGDRTIAVTMDSDGRRVHAGSL